MKKKVVTIIPAAGRGARMLSLTDNCPKSMIPVAGKPLISRLLDQLIEAGQKDVIIVVGYKKEVLVDYVNMMYSKKLKITFVEQKELLGLGHAIYEVTTAVDLKKYEGVFVMLGDSIFGDKNIYQFGKSSYIACMRVTDYSRWCIADVERDNVVGFFDKPTEEPKDKLAVLGAYYFSKPKLFSDSAEKAIESGKTIAGEYQISTIMEEYLKSEQIKCLKVSSWFDFGDLTTYNKNKKAFNESRFFNDVRYNCDDTVTKTSSNYHKIQREICWFLALPESLKRFAATLKDFKLADDNASYTMPYCNGVTLQELWLYSHLSEEEWKKIFENIADMLVDFECASEKHTTDLVKFLQTNVDKRIDPNLFNDSKPLVMNHKTLKPLSELKDYFYDKVKSLKTNSASRIIHGDMVFSNIIYDLQTSKITLIDPRGDFNGDIIYGDVRYDLAKLTQCVVGDYDYIVNDLFVLDDNHYELYGKTDRSRLVKDMIKELGFKCDEVLFITAVQFLTMIPLHAENANHQKMMYIRAVELLNECYEMENKDK